MEPIIHEGEQGWSLSSFLHEPTFQQDLVVNWWIVVATQQPHVVNVLKATGMWIKPVSALLLLRAWKEWEKQRWNHLFSAAFLWKVPLVQWRVRMEGYDINQHNPGMCYKNGQVIQLWSFHCFMIYDFFVHLIVQSFTKFSTQGTSVNCGAHKADSCADCPLVWRNLHLLDSYWLFIESIHLW